MLASDTDGKVAEIQRRGLASLSPSQRLTMALEMSDFVKALKLAALWRDHPDASEHELRLIVVKSCFDSSRRRPRIYK